MNDLHLLTLISLTECLAPTLTVAIITVIMFYTKNIGIGWVLLCLTLGLLFYSLPSLLNILVAFEFLNTYQQGLGVM